MNLEKGNRKLKKFNKLHLLNKMTPVSLLLVFTMVGCRPPTTSTTPAKPGSTPVPGSSANPATGATPAPGNSSRPGTPDTAPPTVNVTSPVNAEIGVAVNGKIVTTFSEVMDPASITASTFTVTAPGSTPVTGTVTYVGSVATFTPTSNFATSTTYTATISTGAKARASP